jgi:hypothetical protein
VNLTPPGPAHGPKEFVPRVTAMLKNFREFSVNVGLALDPLKRVSNIAWIFPVGIGLTIHFDGTLDFDVWFNANTDIETGIDLGPFGSFDVGFKNPPDYSDNTPFMILPITTYLGRLGIDHSAVITFDGFHYPSDEVDPFAPQLAPGAGPGAPPADVITTVPDAIVNEALARWRDAGYDTSALGAVKVGVTDLPDNYLGTVTDGTVLIDGDAAGYGWYIDPMPSNDTEFPAVPGDAAYGRMDLLTVVMHEMGHLLGFEDGGQGLMETVLQPGERLSPAPQSGAAVGPAETSATPAPADGGTGGSPTAAVPLGGGSALPLSFAGVPLAPGRSLDGSLAALIVMLSPLPSARQMPPALNDPQRAAILDAVYTRFDDARLAGPLSDHLAPSQLLGIAELHPPDGSALDITALPADPTGAAWQ